jgi:hypothetical protein
MLEPKQRDARAISHFSGTADIREHGTELKNIIHYLLQDITLSTLRAKNRCALQDPGSNVLSQMKPIVCIQRADPLDYVQTSSQAVTTIAAEPVGELSLVHRLIAPVSICGDEHHAHSVHRPSNDIHNVISSPGLSLSRISRHPWYDLKRKASVKG